MTVARPVPVVPVYLLTGFLGSGKTTLLRELLAQRAARGAGDKIGVVINELGAVGIDAALVGDDATRQLELAGGCVCCVLGPELGTTLLGLCDAQPDLAAIVLETTGVAEPLPIAWALEADALAPRLRLAAIITVVDPLELPASRDVSPAVDAQLRAADVVVVSKLDVATSTQRAASEAVLATLAPHAPRLTDGTAAAAGWLDGVMADPALAPARVGATLALPRAAHGIVSVALDVPGVVDLEELEDQLAALPSTVVRLKGIVRAVDGRRGLVGVHLAEVHRVGLRTSSAPLPDDGHRGPGRLVALGTAVSRAELERAVAAATVEVS